MLILADSVEGGKKQAKKTGHVDRITKIVGYILMVFGLPYNYKPNLSLKMISKPFEPSRSIGAMSVA